MASRTLTTRKGISITTPYTDGEALTRLRGVPSSFAADLLEKSRRYGLSPDQITWAHKLVIEHESKSQETDGPDRTTEGSRYTRIVELFKHAAEHKAYPKIRFNMEDGSVLKLSLCGDKSRYAGSINITDGGSYPNNKFYGRITPSGAHFGNAPEIVKAMLEAFNADPVQVAKDQAEGDVSCIFCGKELDTIESRAHGYGPVCARSYGLPWNEANNRTAKPLKARTPRKSKAKKEQEALDQAADHFVAGLRYTAQHEAERERDMDNLPMVPVHTMKRGYGGRDSFGE